MYVLYTGAGGVHTIECLLLCNDESYVLFSSRKLLWIATTGVHSIVWRGYGGVNPQILPNKGFDNLIDSHFSFDIHSDIP